MRFWFSFLVLFVIAAFILPSRGQAEAVGGRAMLLLTAALLAAFGIGLVKFGQWLGRGEQQAIIAFLKSTLEANDDA